MYYYFVKIPINVKKKTISGSDPIVFDLCAQLYVLCEIRSVSVWERCSLAKLIHTKKSVSSVSCHVFCMGNHIYKDLKLSHKCMDVGVMLAYFLS